MTDLEFKEIGIKFRAEMIKIFRENNQNYFDIYGHFPPQIGSSEHQPLFTQNEMKILVNSFLISLEKLASEEPKRLWEGGTKGNHLADNAADEFGISYHLKNVISEATEAGASPLELAIIILKFSEKTFSSVFLACAVMTNLETKGKLTRNQLISATSKACSGYYSKEKINAFIVAEGADPILAKKTISVLEPFRKFFEDVYSKKGMIEN